jgi:hypothetical protein
MSDQSLDFPRLRRIRSAIQAILESDNDSLHSADGLTEAYNLLRVEARGALPVGLHDEFDRLFVELREQNFGLGPPRVRAQSVAAATARTKLELLGGWLRGALPDGEKVRNPE